MRLEKSVSEGRPAAHPPAQGSGAHSPAKTTSRIVASSPGSGRHRGQPRSKPDRLPARSGKLVRHSFKVEDHSIAPFRGSRRHDGFPRCKGQRVHRRAVAGIVASTAARRRGFQQAAGIRPAGSGLPARNPGWVRCRPDRLGGPRSASRLQAPIGDPIAFAIQLYADGAHTVRMLEHHVQRRQHFG